MWWCTEASLTAQKCINLTVYTCAIKEASNESCTGPLFPLVVELLRIYLFIWPFSALFVRRSEARPGKQGQREEEEDMQQRTVGWTRTQAGRS